MLQSLPFKIKITKLINDVVSANTFIFVLTVKRRARPISLIHILLHPSDICQQTGAATPYQSVTEWSVTLILMSSGHFQTREITVS